MFSYTVLQLSRNPYNRERRGVKETEQCRGPRQWGNHIQFLETADMIHCAFSSIQRLLQQEGSTYRAKDCISRIVGSKKLKRFAKIIINVGCCRCIQTTL